MKVFWTILITIVLTAIIVSVGTYYYLASTVEETTETDLSDYAEWQTYQNGEYGFSIMYPADWFATTSTNDEGEVIITNFEYPADNGRGLNETETKRVISIVDNSQMKTARELFDAENDSLFSSDKTISEETVTVGGKEATKVIADDSTLIYVPISDTTMVLITVYSSIDQLDDMLQTFQITTEKE